MLILDLSHNDLGHESGEQFVHLVNTGLRELDLSNNRLKDKGL